MAVSVTEITRGHLGNKKAVVSEVTFDSGYPAGGEAITASDFGLVSIVAVFTGLAASAAGDVSNLCWYDKAAGKLQLFDSGTTGVDFPEQGTADQSAKVVTVLVIGH